MENKPTLLETIFVSTFGFFIAVVFVYVYSAAAAFAWNYAVAHPFHLPEVHFYQVMAALFLVGVTKRILR